MPKISSAFQRGHPNRAQNRGGYVQIGDFRPISRYISKTVQDRDIRTIKRMHYIEGRYFQRL